MKNINRETKKKIKQIAKKGAGLSLCAVLVGGLSAAAFEGMNTIAGWNQQNVQAAVKKDDGVRLLTSTSEESSAGKGSLDVSDIVAKAMPSVVSITTKSIQEVQDFYDIFGYGYGYMPREREVEGSGSGIIIGKNDDELLVVTNNHVIEGADTVSVTFVDGEVYEAALKGANADKDLAVVAVPLEEISDDTLDKISIATIGSSDDLMVGEQVVAIGNALGYGQSVTTGIVSAKNRQLNEDVSSEDDIKDSENGVNLIQTDAAINPGNSGGALLNMNGEVIGINSAKLASTNVEGMGYAIAISDVTDILENLMNKTTRERLEEDEHGTLGIVGSTVSEEVIRLYGIPGGVLVREVTEGGAADKAGIEKGAIITEFDGEEISDINQLVDLLYYYEPGEEAEIVVAGLGNGSYEEEALTVTLQEPESEEDGDKDNKDSEDKKSKDREDEGESILEDWEEDNGLRFGEGW